MTSPLILPLILALGVFLATGLPLVLVWRKRIQWRSTELAMIPVPWLFWQLLEWPGVSWHPGKTWENLLVENALMGFLPVLYILFRRWARPGPPTRLDYYGGAALGLLCAFCLHRFMPTLGMIYG